MLVKASLPLLAVSLFSFAAIAQTATAVHPDPSRTAADPRVRMQAEVQAHAAEIRHAWIASGHKAAPPTASTCQVTGGKILTPKLNLTNQPAAPEVQVSFSGCPAEGISEIFVYFYPTITGQYLYSFYDPSTYSSPPQTHGTVAFQVVGGSYGYGEFNVFSAPGTWTLENLYIYDRTGNYRSYGQANLAALFPNVTIKLVNKLKPDTAPPLFTAAQVLTPMVSKSSSWPAFGAKLTLSDDVSGVSSTSVTVCPPAGSSASCVGWNSYVSVPVLSGNVKDYDYLCDPSTHDCSAVPKGTWTIYGYGACDVANNCASDYNAADIMALFGTTTFRVTK